MSSTSPLIAAVLFVLVVLALIGFELFSHYWRGFDD
jgi:flagellin-like protein